MAARVLEFFMATFRKRLDQLWQILQAVSFV